MNGVAPAPVRPSPAPGGHGPRSRRVALVVLVAAVVALVGSVAASPWIVGGLSGARSGPVPGSGPVGRVGRGMMGGPGGAGMMGGPGGAGMMGGRGAAGPGGMMAGQVWLAGDGVPVTSIAAARARAAAAAAPSGWHPGEIVRFTRNVYVELKDGAGASVTEVLVDPASGAVTTEPGPAMMWNTGSRTAIVPADRARSVADAWLKANRPGETVTSVDAYPGYYTLDTATGPAAGATPVGMLSVNASTGAVWYHTWHGTFLAKEDA